MRFNILIIAVFLILTANIYSIDTNLCQDMKQEGKYTFTYEEHHYDGVGDSFLIIEKTGSGYKAVWKGINDTTVVFADKNYNTEKVIITDKKRELTVLKIGNKLKVIGYSCGEKIDKTLKLGCGNWYQIIPFALIPFTTSKEEKMTFSVFDPYNLKVRDIEVKKKKTEIANIKGKKYSAVKMTMRLDSLLKPFWKSEIWNNAETGVYLKYEGLNVVPKLYKSKMYLTDSEYYQIIGERTEEDDKKKT